MKWYTIDEKFMEFIRKYEKRIPKMDYGKYKFKPFFGELFSVGNLVYVTQVSHPQSRHNKLKEAKDFMKLYDGNSLIAVVNLNYMFPVYRNELIEVRYKNIHQFRPFLNDYEKGKYISLLKKEMKEIKRKEVTNKAIELYNMKYEYPNNTISLRCLDFKDLENKCKEYELINQISEQEPAATLDEDNNSTSPE